LLFSDPLFHPEWAPQNRPPWPGLMPSEPFRRWLSSRLFELDILVFKEMKNEMSATLSPEHFSRMADSLGSPVWQEYVQRAYDAMNELALKGEKQTVHNIENKMKRMAEPKRRGRTRSPSNPAHDLATMAAWDIWKLRRVVLPRFWPKEACGEFHLHDLELAKVAARRHKCEPKEANRQYVDQRIAGA